MGQATRVAIGVELATVERLDAIIAAVLAERGDAEREAGDLDSYDAILDWATDITMESTATADLWARAEREAYHRAATLGPLVLISIDANLERALCGGVAAMQGTVTYEPVYATAISMFLNVAKWSGHPAPGED